MLSLFSRVTLIVKKLDSKVYDMTQEAMYNYISEFTDKPVEIKKVMEVINAAKSSARGTTEVSQRQWN